MNPTRGLTLALLLSLFFGDAFGFAPAMTDSWFTDHYPHEIVHPEKTVAAWDFVGDRIVVLFCDGFLLSTPLGAGKGKSAKTRVTLHDLAPNTALERMRIDAATGQIAIFPGGTQVLVFNAEDLASCGAWDAAANPLEAAAWYHGGVLFQVLDQQDATATGHTSLVASKGGAAPQVLREVGSLAVGVAYFPNRDRYLMLERIPTPRFVVMEGQSPPIPLIAAVDAPLNHDRGTAMSTNGAWTATLLNPVDQPPELLAFHGGGDVIDVKHCTLPGLVDEFPLLLAIAGDGSQAVIDAKAEVSLVETSTGSTIPLLQGLDTNLAEARVTAAGVIAVLPSWNLPLGGNARPSPTVRLFDREGKAVGELDLLRVRGTLEDAPAGNRVEGAPLSSTSTP